MVARDEGDDVNFLAGKLARLFDAKASDKEKLPLDHEASDVDDRRLRAEFHSSMIDLCRRSNAEVRYNPTILARMLQEQGGLAVAKKLAVAQRPSEGFQALWERGRLDLTVEFLVCSTRYRRLFSEEELRQAAQRLRDWGLDPDEYF